MSLEHLMVLENKEVIKPITPTPPPQHTIMGIMSKGHRVNQKSSQWLNVE